MSKVEVSVPPGAQGLGFFGVLVLFLTLGFVSCKVMGWGIVAGWSWWMVFLPAILYVFVPLALVLMIWALFLMGAAVGVLGAVGFFLVRGATRSIKRKYAARKR